MLYIRSPDGNARPRVKNESAIFVFHLVPDGQHYYTNIEIEPQQDFSGSVLLYDLTEEDLKFSRMSELVGSTKLTISSFGSSTAPPKAPRAFVVKLTEGEQASASSLLKLSYEEHQWS
jgi:hypothetical protein